MKTCSRVGSAYGTQQSRPVFLKPIHRLPCNETTITFSSETVALRALSPDICSLCARDDIIFDNRNDSLVLEDRLTEEKTNVVISNPFLALSIQQQRIRLPIFKYRSHILYLLEKYRILIIVGETGCGKSTQVPQNPKPAFCTMKASLII
uniref:Myosin motor domain-containing protein n=1 Tax=Elaeophora elaphi TaxID=1147741 RepID=A0A158Q8I6_9BILA